MIAREATSALIHIAGQFKAVAVVGPRQSGKTTLVRAVFADKPYANLENPDIRAFAADDPKGFLANYPDGAILDEVQRVPELFSYLQQVLDESDRRGMFILTGSNNFLIQERISQSLAGRFGYLFLLPLSLQEMPDETQNSNEWMFRGGYPSLHTRETDISLFYENYIRTYVERDVRLIKNITDLYVFERFIRLCAGRVGQLLNMSSLAVETGVDVKTVGAWIGVLETAFVIFRLHPYHKNYNKRIVKTPKLYFVDTGLACALLGISSADQLTLHPFRGGLFENMVVSELKKQYFNQGKSARMYFWRDNTGNEIDVIIEKADHAMPVEIKSGKTITPAFFKGIKYWQKLTNRDGGFIIYDGDSVQKRSDGITLLPIGQAYQARISPRVRKLRGIIKTNENLDHKKILTEELSKKYGI